MEDSQSLPPGAENRRAPRSSFQATVAVYDSAGTGHVATLHDMSTGGAGVEAKEPLNPGEEVVLQIGQLRISSRVAHCRQLENGEFFMGLEFSKPR